MSISAMIWYISDTKLLSKKENTKKNFSNKKVNTFYHLIIIPCIVYNDELSKKYKERIGNFIK